MTNPSAPGTGPFGLHDIGLSGTPWPTQPVTPLQMAANARDATKTHSDGSGIMPAYTSAPTPPSTPSPPNGEFKGHTPGPGEGTPIKTTLRLFVFAAMNKTLNGGVELAKFLFGVLVSIKDAGVRLCRFLLETLEHLRDLILKLLNGIVDDRKWFVIFVTIVLSCLVSYTNHGILWQVGEVIGSRICTLSTTGQCSNTAPVTATQSDAPATEPESEQPTTRRNRRGQSP